MIETLLGGLGDKKIKVEYHTRDGRDTSWLTKFSGVRTILFEKYQETTSETMRTHLEKYIREEPCPTCHGEGLVPATAKAKPGKRSR